MEYNQKLTSRLLKPGRVLNVGGVAVECKAVPDGQSKALDPRQLKKLLAAREERSADKGVEPSLAVRRGRMGGFNYKGNGKISPAFS